MCDYENNSLKGTFKLLLKLANNVVLKQSSYKKLLR